jgi:DNA topoisomerase-1
MGGESRNLGGGDDGVALTIGLEEALAIFAQPKQFRGRGAPRPPLATFGEDPVSGKKIILKEGKFGFYVTDGETNASLRRGDDQADLTPERAQELLAERREYMASPEGQEKAALRATRRGGRGVRVAKAGRASAAPKGKPASAAAKAKPASAAAKPAAEPRPAKASAEPGTSKAKQPKVTKKRVAKT